MTEPEPSPDDLLVSSCLDGTATPDERAQVARDPALATRLDAFELVAARVRGDVTMPEPDVRDAVIAQALGEFAPADDVNPPDELAAARARRNATPRLLVAAAVLAILAVGAAVGLARRSSDVGSDDLASRAATSTEASIETGVAAGAAQGDSYSPAGAVAPSSSAVAGAAGSSQGASAPAQVPNPPSTGDLGSAATPEDLRSHVVAALSPPAPDHREPTPTSTTQAAAVTSGSSAEHRDPSACEATARATVTGATDLRLEATIVYTGQPAYAYAYTNSSGTVVVATSADPAAGCAVLTTVQL